MAIALLDFDHMNEFDIIIYKWKFLTEKKDIKIRPTTIKLFWSFQSKWLSSANNQPYISYYEYSVTIGLS